MSDTINGFTPKLKMKTKLTSAYNNVFTPEHLQYYESVAREIYNAATFTLLETVQSGYGSSIVINLALEQVETQFLIDDSLYSYLGIWRALKKICDEEDLILYEIGNATSILTF